MVSTLQRLIVILTILIPTITSAQVLQESTPVPAGAEAVEVLPVVASSDVPWSLVAGVVSATAAMVFVGVAGEELGIGCLDGSLIVVGALGLGILAGNLICGEGASPGDLSTGVRTASGATYEVDALEAFASGEMTERHRQSLASSARAAHQEAVVLRRVVTPSQGVGVGEAGTAPRLEVAILDAGTSQWRVLGDGLLAPVTRAAVVIEGGDVEAANAEAMQLVDL